MAGFLILLAEREHVFHSSKLQLTITPFMDHALSVVSKKSLLKPRSPPFSPTYRPGVSWFHALQLGLWFLLS